MILIGFIGGHLKSKPTQEKPVVSELNYLKDLDSEEGYWMAMYGMKAEDNLQKLKGGSKGVLPGYFSRALVKNESVTIDSTLDLNIQIIRDSSIVRIDIEDMGALYTMIEFDGNSIDSVWINKELVNHPDPASKAIFITGYTFGNIDIEAKSSTQGVLSGNVYSFVKGIPNGAPVLEGHVRFGQFTILKRKF